MKTNIFKRRRRPCKGHAALNHQPRWPLRLAAALLLLAGCNPPGNPAGKKSALPPPPPAPTFTFSDITPHIGVAFRYDHHPEADYRTILESLGGGAALLDYDADGQFDLAFPGGGVYGNKKIDRGLPLGLFRNRGQWLFEPVSAAAYADKPRHFSHGTAVGDYDRDGFSDLLVTGYGGVQLWRNLGDGTFDEVPDAAGLNDALWSTSAAWGDVTGDGELDLYVVHYVNWSFDNNPDCPAQNDPGERDICSPTEFEGLPDTLYVNQGDGTFRDGSREAGLREDGKGLGVVLADLDADRDLDIYVANDTTANFLYLNDGSGKLTEVAEAHGCAASASGRMDGSMGVDICDFNHDGEPDLWVANFEAEDFALYHNVGQARYDHYSRRAGISALGTSQVAFGTQCGDFDLDGDEDIFVVNGHTSLFPTRSERRQQPMLILNHGGRFEMMRRPEGTFLDTPRLGRGLAMGDLDGDGDLDAAVSHLEERVAVLRCEQQTANHWLALRLIGTRSHRDAVGTRVTLHTDRGDREAQRAGGRSYLSSPEPLVRFGIPAGEIIRSITIHWHSGIDQEVTPQGLDRVVTEVEASDAP